MAANESNVKFRVSNNVILKELIALAFAERLNLQIFLVENYSKRNRIIIGQISKVVQGIFSFVSAFWRFKIYEISLNFLILILADNGFLEIILLISLMSIS